MFEFVIQVAVFSIVLAGVGALILSSRRHGNGKSLATCKTEAIDQFDLWLKTPGAIQLGLSSGGCEVVQESETFSRNEGDLIYSYTLTRFMRNQEGRYFMFKSTPRGPYVKPVDPSIAKIVLKKAYVSAPSA